MVAEAVEAEHLALLLEVAGMVLMDLAMGQAVVVAEQQLEPGMAAMAAMELVVLL
jgi:hypothetical protein